MRTLPLICLLAGAATAGAAGLDYSVLLGTGTAAGPACVAADAQGNIYVAGQTSSPTLPATANALQPSLNGPSDAFIAKFSAGGALLWATYFGGSADDAATGVAVDAAGNVLVAGITRSQDFPQVNAIPGSAAGAFALKLDPTGTRILYSTFIGSGNQVVALAADSAGNAYLTGAATSGFPGIGANGQSGSFVAKLNPAGALSYATLLPNLSATAIAVDASGSAYILLIGPKVTVVKLSADGSRMLYQAGFSGTGIAYATDGGWAVAVDTAGSAYVAGVTRSVDFPLVRPLQSSLGARPLWKSADGGSTWTPLDGLPFANLTALVVDPSSPNVLYAATTDAGVFKSTDGGAVWIGANQGIASTWVSALAINPGNPQILYAGTGSSNTGGGAVYRTADGGNTWSAVDPGLYEVTQLAVDPLSPNTVYAVTDGSVTRRTADGGATWNTVPFSGDGIASLALDPRTGGNLYAYSILEAGAPFFGGGLPAYLFHSADGGASWSVDFANPTGPGVTIDGSTKPSTVYAGLTARSTDGGNTWAAITPPVASGDLTVVMADARSATLYAATLCSGILASGDQGRSWTATGSPVPTASPCREQARLNALVPGGAPGAFYAIVQNVQSTAFVTKLSPDGSSIVYSTLLNGHPNMGFGPGDTYQFAQLFGDQNWADAIALDPSGNIVVAGGTHSTGFPLANPAQSANAGGDDAFVAVLSADGSQLRYSTYLGGSQNDGATAVAVDPYGNLIVAGLTASSDFPGAGAPTSSTVGSAFVAKLTPGEPVVTAVLNGASFQPGIEAGSWVTIQGANLANNTRTWRGIDFAGGNLPTQLDGVSVAIDGKPAFVEYVSPTQINVQAPSDNALGVVSVVADNNGALSAPGTAQLQAAAPAFFLYPGTNYAIASRLPDYAPVGDPSAVPGTVAAKPGNTLALWGTGFGATNPPVAAGTTVAGAPAAVTAPTVTVGGMAVPVVSAVLTVGSAGLYQVTIQLPANVPTGAVAVQASVGGVPTQAGVAIFVAPAALP